MITPTDRDEKRHDEPATPLLKPEEDGRNIEWEDRARVNLERVPEDTSTNIERDFEPETPSADVERKADETPPY